MMYYGTFEQYNNIMPINFGCTMHGTLHCSWYSTAPTTVESHNYASPFVHANIGQNKGGGLYTGSLHFRVTTITDRRMPHGCMIPVLSLAIWLAKLKKTTK